MSTSSTAANWPVRLIDSRTSPGWAATSKSLTVAVPASAFSNVDKMFTSGGLAGTVGPEEREDASCCHVELDAAQHLDVLERLLDALYSDGWLGGHFCSCCSASSTALVRRARSLSIHCLPV